MNPTPRTEAIWAARLEGETVAEIGARFALSREKVTQVCVMHQAIEQRACEEARCRPPVHEPPCRRADPVELNLASEERPK